MGLYTSLSLAEARALGADYGLEVISSEGLLAGSVNSNLRLWLAGGRRAFLRIYEEQGLEGARSEIDLLRWQIARGTLTPDPLPLLAGGWVTTHRGKPVAAFPWVEGVSRRQSEVREADVFLLGEALAQVHLAGAPGLRPGRFRVADLRDRCQVIAGASDPALAALAPRFEALLGEVEATRVGEATVGLCHGDLFRDNVLWQDERLVALLDFESAAEGSLAFDLAVTMLAWCYLDDFDPALVRALVAGYQARRPLPAVDREALFAEARLAALRFTITRVTDYSMRAHLGATRMRDYRRFLARFDRLTALGPGGLRELAGLGEPGGRGLVADPGEASAGER
jgi:homoserine kinase type II